LVNFQSSEKLSHVILVHKIEVEGHNVVTFVKKFEEMFTCFDTIDAHDRQT